MPPTQMGRAREDAAVRSLWFVDSLYGWASGDDGSLLHTRDGGRTWLPQDSGVACTLTAVRFASRDRGWAVGGWIEPDTQLSRGVILRTDNGGATWQRVESDLPWLRALEIGADGTLIAAGDWSLKHLASIFESRDQGTSWHAAVGCDEVGPVRSLASGGGELMALSRSGVVFRSREGLWEASLARPSLAVLAASGSQLVAADAEGFSVSPADSQLDWHPPAGAASLPIAPQTAAAREQVCWMAGSPAASVTRWSADEGLSAVATGMVGAIHALHFYDAQQGWAGGSFGQIAHTSDGGRSWQIVRGGARRAGLLVVGQSADRLPWLAIGTAASERGVRTVVSLGAGVAESSDPVLPSREVAVGEVLRELGGAELMRRPGGTTPAELLAQWRPIAVVLARDISEAEARDWMGAIGREGRDGARRLLQVADPARSRLTIRGATVLPTVGEVLGQFTARAVAALDPDRPREPRLDLHILWNAVGVRSDRIETILPSVDPETHEASHRPPAAGSVRNLALVQARAKYEQFVDRLAGDAVDPRGAAVADRLEGLLRKIGAGERVPLLRLAEASFRDLDHPAGWQAVLATAEKTAPESGYGRRAALRLRQISGSKEWGKLLRPPSMLVQQAGGAVPRSAPSRSPFEREDPVIAQATALEHPREHAPVDSLPPDLVWSQHPLWLLAASAEGGAPNENLRNRQDRWIRHPASGIWGRVIRWKRDEASGGPPLSAGHRIHFAPTPPVLDGRLEDSCWKETDQPLQIAYDARHLFFAFRVPGTRASGANAAGRARDAAGPERKRVVIEIDVDGDLATAFRLEIDDRGWTRDSCDGFTGWQPRWWVDTADVEDGWVVEAAIDRRDLDDLPPVAGQSWRVRSRVLPPGVVLPMGPAMDPAGWNLAVFQ